MKIWGVFLLITTLAPISKCASTNKQPKHEPQVHEDLDEEPPKYVRTARHLGKEEKLYQPPTFNYKKMVQQDRMKSRYHSQQQADIRNLKILPLDHDTTKNQKTFVKQEGSKITSIMEEDWKPFQPSFLKLEQEEKIKGDLDAAGSDAIDRSYIYVSPKALSKDFGLDSKTTQEILRTAAPETKQEDSYQVHELQELLGKNPELQLQGLQKLLQEAGNGGNDAGIQVDHNGSPSHLLATVPQYHTFQQQIDAFNKAQEEKVLTAARQQADSHVQAQRDAIALAQKHAQAQAYAKIAAHNRGMSTLSPDSVEVFSGGRHVSAKPLHRAPPVEEIVQNSLSEVSALQARPVEQVYAGSFGLPEEDLRHFKPKTGVLSTESPLGLYQSTLRPSPTPEVYHEIKQFYGEKARYPEHDGDSQIREHKGRVLSTEAPLVLYHQSTLAPSFLPVSPTSTSEVYGEVKQLYAKNGHQQHNDLHQYAANYAFGYRIVDEKHGNDYGHEEERKGPNTKGHYYVTLPDGRKQKVDYFADNSGYHARVSYEHVAKHPNLP